MIIPPFCCLISRRHNYLLCHYHSRRRMRKQVLMVLTTIVCVHTASHCLSGKQCYEITMKTYDVRSENIMNNQSSAKVLQQLSHSRGWTAPESSTYTCVDIDFQLYLPVCEEIVRYSWIWLHCLLLHPIIRFMCFLRHQSSFPLPTVNW